MRIHHIFFSALVLLALAPASATAQAFVTRIEGQLRERGTRAPLEGITVFLIPQANPEARLKGFTDQNGKFQVENIPEGTFSWIVNAPGYIKLEQVDQQLAGAEARPRDLYLEKDSYQVYETTIYDQAQKRDSSMRTLKREELLGSAGTGGDPVRAVQNLPGINRPQSFSSQVLIQGSGPQETVYQINNVEVPLVFHFGGITSALMPEAVDRVDVFQAGYGPELGRATGGIIGIWTRPARRDRMHGLLSIDTFNTGGVFETPIGSKSGILVSARQSYIGQVLRAVLKGRDEFDLTVVPTYRDGAVMFDSELTPIDQFRLTAVGSNDTLEFLLKEPLRQDPAVRGTFESATAFFRVIPSLTHKHSGRTTSRWTLGYGRDWLKVITSENFFRLKTHQATMRGEVERRMFEQWTAFLGFDHRLTWADAQINLPYFFPGGGVVNPLSVGTQRRTTISARHAFVGGYTRNEIRITGTPWTLLPNLRIDHFTQTEETFLQPRPAVRYAIDESLMLRASGGQYHQPPQPGETDPTFGNPDLKAPRAWHANIGADKDFRGGTGRGWTVSGDAFYKKLERLVIPSPGIVVRNGSITTENYSNQGSGSVVGAQTQIKLDAAPWSFSTIYTLARSRRSEPGRDNIPSQYDQTHLLGLLGSVQLPSNWSISARFRLSTGAPVTPIIGSVFDADNDVFIPTRGLYYSERLPAFYQLDLRFDKKWIFDTWILSLYLDIFNATNRRNQELLIYSYNYSQSQAVQGLPILPTFGLKGEF